LQNGLGSTKLGNNKAKQTGFILKLSNIKAKGTGLIAILFLKIEKNELSFF
jgi:hypothetical protein